MRVRSRRLKLDFGCIPSGVAPRQTLDIKKWADAHANLPTGQGGFAKADVALRSNKAASAFLAEGFFHDDEEDQTGRTTQYGPVHDWAHDPSGKPLSVSAGGGRLLQEWLHDRHQAFGQLIAEFADRRGAGDEAGAKPAATGQAVERAQLDETIARLRAERERDGLGGARDYAHAVSAAHIIVDCNERRAATLATTRRPAQLHHR
jgi:hypothetical protein